MFLVNSRYHQLTATTFSSRSKSLHLPVVHLLPKLRCHFAEFLNQSYLKRLGILFLPTCVGLRYDRLSISLEVFLGSMGSITLRTYVLVIVSQAYRETDLPISQPYTLEPGNPAPG